MSFLRDLFVRAEDVFGFVVAVDVSGDEIDGNVFLFAVGQETSAQAACAVDGPPTRRRGLTRFIASAA